MPELAEVEFYRKCWDAGLGRRVVSIYLHEEKRIFRGTDIKALARTLPGKKLAESRSSGKRLAFRFSGGAWLGIHLGMTGSLRVEGANHQPGKHDHLVLFLKECSLVFSDMRQFGRVLFFQGVGEPDWWRGMPPAVNSPEFTFERVRGFLARHGKLPVKAALLLQHGFAGIGNWMADEILWRAKIAPARLAKYLDDLETKALYRETKKVAAIAIRTAGKDLDSLPKNWLFHQRWSKGGLCPRHGTPLEKSVLGGRSAAWCPECQK